MDKNGMHSGERGGEQITLSTRKCSCRAPDLRYIWNISPLICTRQIWFAEDQSGQVCAWRTQRRLDDFVQLWVFDVLHLWREKFFYVVDTCRKGKHGRSELCNFSFACKFQFCPVLSFCRRRQWRKRGKHDVTFPEFTCRFRSWGRGPRIQRALSTIQAGAAWPHVRAQHRLHGAGSFIVVVCVWCVRCILLIHRLLPASHSDELVAAGNPRGLERHEAHAPGRSGVPLCPGLPCPGHPTRTIGGRQGELE